MKKTQEFEDRQLDTQGPPQGDHDETIASADDFFVNSSLKALFLAEARIFP